MKVTTVYLLVLAVLGSYFVNAQSPATQFSGFPQRTITLETFKNNEVLPPCYEASYTITNSINPCSVGSNGVLTYSNLLVNFFPTSSIAISAPSDDITINLYAVVGGVRVPVPVSHLLDDTLTDGTHYVVDSCSVAPDGVTVIRSPSAVAASTGCGIGYYCSGFCDLGATQFVVVVGTGSAENDEGIIYNLAVNKVDLAVQKLTLGTTSRHASFVPNSESPNFRFLATQWQHLYYVDVGPSGSTLTAVANYLAQASGYVNLSFRVSGLTVNGASTVCTCGTGSCDQWDLYVRKGDLTITPSSLSASRTDTVGSCPANHDSEFLCSTNYLEVLFAGCNSAGRYFVSVAYPVGATLAQQYDITVQYLPINDQQVIPTFATLSTNTDVADFTLGEWGNNPSVSFQEAYVLLNFAKTAATDDLFVTIFGIATGSISATVSQTTLGYHAACDEGIITCQARDGKSTRDDYCKLKIPSCAYNPSIDAPYWVTVRVDNAYTYQDGYDYSEFSESTTGFYSTSSFSVNAQVVPIDLRTVTALAATSTSTYNRYVDVTTVNEQAYIHYVLNVPRTGLTRSHRLQVVMYPNNEQEEVILAYNAGSLAGSASPVIDNVFSYNGLTPKAVDNGPTDSCFQASWVCGTAGKESTFGYTYSKNVGSCTAVLVYCDLLASDNHYFSVYGVDSSPTSEGNDDQIKGPFPYNGEVGYERSVSYTIEFTLWSAPDALNVDETINVQVPYAIAQPDGFAGLNNYYTQQFRFDVPADNENYFVDRVRIRLASAIQSRNAELNDEVTLRLSINCADTAGDCPCFTKYDSCDVVPIPQQFYFDDDNFGSSCDVTVPFCECPSGVFYASVESIGTSSFPGGFDSVFTLTAYYDEVELRDDIVTVPSTLTGSLIDSEDNKPIDVNFLYGFDVLIDRLTSTTYDSHLYRLRIPDANATTQALKITLKTVPRSHTPTGQLGIMSISRDSVAPAGYGLSDCSRDCLVEQGDFLTAVGSAYCSIVYEPCDFAAGDYYIRVTGLSGTAADSFEFRGLDYTIHVETVDYAPKTLAIPSAAEYTIGEYEQNHYSLSLSGLQANQWLRVALYLDADQTADDRNQIRLFYNFDAPAGDNCYSSVRSCLVNSYSLNSAYCDVFFAPCELKNVSTLYLSTRSEYYAEVSYQSVYYPSHIVGNQRLRYSLSVATGGVVSLDDGHPRKANLLARQEHYYSFTIPASASNILHVQVQSTEPYRYNEQFTGITNLKTSISKIQPENGVSYDCPCSDIVFENEFTTTNYPCELASQAGTYYIKVRALFEGADFPRDPISYTVRVWWTPIQSVTLPLGTTFTKVPQPLNYNQWIDYSITVPSGIGANQVLSIEIADITDSTFTNGNDGLLAFLSNNGIASPDNQWGLWSYGTFTRGCHRQVCALINTDGDDAPAPNNVMYASEFTPCNTCGNTFHLTIKPRLYEPQPSILNRVNFTVRAYLRDVTIPVGFVDSATLRTLALQPGGYTYNFDFNTPLVNYDRSYVADGFDCDGFSRDYYFRLPSLSVQSFEDLVVTLPGVDANPQLTWELSADPGASLVSENVGCDDFSGSYGDCSAAATFNLYGVIGLQTVSNDPFNLTTAGASINIELFQDNVYALPPSTPTTNLPTVDATVGPHTLSPGQYRVYSFQYISTLLTTVSEVTLTPTASAGTPTYCVSFGAADATFPCTCQPITSIFLEPCCVANNTQVFITVFNNNANGNDATFSIDVDVDTYARGITALPIPTNAGSTGAVAAGGLYDIYSFTLTRANFAPDAVLNFRFSDTTADAVTRTVYLNLYELSGDNNDEDCLDFFYQCNVGDDDCFIQLPQCFFPTPYGTYYFSVVSADGTSANSGTSFSLFVTNPTVITVGGSAVQGTVPDIASAPVDYLTHFKFQYARVIGELGPEDQEFGLRLVLTANSLTNNLELFIADSRTNGQNNVLAGPSGIFSGGCSYSSSFVGWDCDSTTLSVSGSITCDAVFCDNSVWNWATLANEFIYVSVQNTDNSVNRVATPFSITVSRVSATLPVDEAIFPITPRVANTDVESNVACSLSANSFGCNFVQSSFVQLDTAYFRVDLSDIASWGETDYLLVNVTNFNGNLDLDWFLSDRCESAASGITCNPSSPDLCYLDSDPCTWRSSFLALPGTNVIGRNAYVRVQWSGSVDFHIEIHRVTPARNTIVLSAASPSYTNTFVMWDERYAMFNFELPQTGTYDFHVEVDTECVDPNFEPEIYVNRFEYRWATEACSERASNTDFEETIPHCKVGGNYFITVVGPRRAVDYPVAVTIPEGNVSPQIRFTISATITPHSWTPYAWECTTDLITSASKNFLAYADAENFGTQLAVGLTDCGSSCSLKIISPLYRSVYNTAAPPSESKRGTFYNDINQPQAAYNDEFYILNAGGCAVPSCDSEGVYCCDTTDSCFIELDTCEFRNGRWFIYVTQTVPSAGVRLSSTIDRKDIPILTVGSANNYHSIVHSEIRNAPFASNGLGYAQYYKVVADGTQKYLDINVGINIPEDELHEAFEECFWSYNPDVELSVNDCAALARKRMIVSISSGDYGYSTAAFGSSSGINGITASSCSDVSFQCITNPLSRQCTYRAEVCAGNTFYVAVYSDYDFNNIDCRSLPYYVEAVGNTPNFQTITPGVPVCGTVWNIESRAEFILDEFYIYDTLKYAYDPSNYYYNENYFYLADEDDDAQNYDFPNRIMYKVDTTGIDLAFANLDVTLEQYHGKETNANLVLSYSNKPASDDCNFCEDRTFGSDDDDFAGFNVDCGLDNIWITVETNKNTPQVPATDFWLRVNVTPRAKQTITVPSLSGHTVSTVSASYTADETIFTVDNTVQQRIITGVSAPDFEFVAGDNKRTSCSSSCPSVSACDRAAAKVYYLVGVANSKPFSDCETVSTPAATMAVTFQNVVPLTVNQATAGTICGTDAVSVHYYSVAVPTDNTFLGFTFDLLGATGPVDIYAACDQDPLHGCQDWHLAFGAGSTFRDYSCASCSRVILAVVPSFCEFECTRYTLQVNSVARDTALSSTSLTTQWLGGAIQRYGVAPVAQTKDYTVTAGSDGFVHVAIGNVNGTRTNQHEGLLEIYRGAPSDNCLVASCFSGDNTYLNAESLIDDDNNEDHSCFVHFAGTPGQVYTARVSPDDQIDSSSAGLFYRIQAFTAFTPLTSTASSAVLQGTNRHYYSVAGVSASGAPQSVVIHLNVDNGPRLLVEVADSPSYRFAVDSSNIYNGWSQAKTCYFGECTIEVATTAAQHSGAAVFYVWVTPVAPAAGESGIEKESVYRISATTGSGNCVASGSLTSSAPFCASNLASGSSYFAYRSASQRDSEASCRYDSLLCRCTAPLPTCQTALKRFSCLESFRECDANGFWTPVCRGECSAVEASCGSWLPDSLDALSTTCSCGRSEFSCGSSRYADAETCTGVNPAPSPSPVPVVSSEETTEEATSDVYYDDDSSDNTNSNTNSKSTIITSDGSTIQTTVTTARASSDASRVGVWSAALALFALLSVLFF